MTTKERLHKLIDELPDAQAAEVLDFASARATPESASGGGGEEHRETAEEREWALANAREAIREEPW
jgi:hypothetical protein